MSKAIDVKDLSDRELLESLVEKLYYSKGPMAVASAYAERTGQEPVRQVVTRLASKIGVKMSKKAFAAMRREARRKYTKWSDEDLAVLKKHYPSLGPTRLVKMYLPNRSVGSVKKKAEELGVYMLNSARCRDNDFPPEKGDRSEESYFEYTTRLSSNSSAGKSGGIWGFDQGLYSLYLNALKNRACADKRKRYYGQ